MRLFLLAVIMGVTGWAALARLLRAETMKVAAMDFVTAAKAFGVSPWRIMRATCFRTSRTLCSLWRCSTFRGLCFMKRF